MIYTCVMSSGRKARMVANSAASAIEEARWMLRGLTVEACYSGFKEGDGGAIAYVDYEVPPHGPIPAEAIREFPGLHKPKDESLPMFDDKAIREESQKAKDKFNET